ncbi:hypothetical protein G7K_6307-t1 [Saitoella complicata NRRL Y-17804]|uniref:Uncharacterized protein n=1 Tax=Saitoella complicata (strain BCRC 22490 / CBS 7301 / JCM 7358 / NBRC 10748 / NRRL Y-17804) TaxID=698492 RepID=A0A0E9NS16_SAICN|nr:hypothetical protein G7K_6307-t1 [Saitoella complicata NRRL Y-17804]
MPNTKHPTPHDIYNQLLFPCPTHFAPINPSTYSPFNSSSTAVRGRFGKSVFKTANPAEIALFPAAGVMSTGVRWARPSFSPSPRTPSPSSSSDLTLVYPLYSKTLFNSRTFDAPILRLILAEERGWDFLRVLVGGKGTEGADGVGETASSQRSSGVCTAGADAEVSDTEGNELSFSGGADETFGQGAWRRRIVRGGKGCPSPPRAAHQRSSSPYSRVSVCSHHQPGSVPEYLRHRPKCR